MKPNDQDRIANLLQQALPPAEENAEPARDLWPVVLRRLDANSARVPWFDWALLAGIGVFAAVSPAWIPVILYYL
jgi:hypothetical protein